jgi:serine protease Do
MGIVSALARSGGDGDYQFFIQTDAAINPGNSGGALITSDGRLAGINTAIVSRSGGNIGIGFAIPANLARRILEGALGGGVKLPWIGAEGQSVTAQIAASMGLSRPGGVVLKSVFPGGPAADSGLKVGDVVLAIDGVSVDDMQALNYRIATHRAGDTPTLKIHSNGNTRDVSVKLELPPESPPREATTISGQNPLAGAKVQNLSPSVATEMQISQMSKGVVIASVAPNGPAAGYGFRPGDIVRVVNGTRIERVGDLVRVLNASRGWDMVVERDGRQMNLSVR